MTTPRKSKKPLFFNDDSAIGKNKKKTKKRHSKEEGDQPELHDQLFNFVAGSCFEIGSSLTFLDNPGQAGQTLQPYAEKMAQILNKIYDTDWGNTEMTVNGKKTTIKAYFNERVLKEFHPDESDQIGRSLEIKDGRDWYSGKGKAWLVKQLLLKSSDPAFEFKNMLTKIRALCALGTVISDLNTSNKAILSDIIPHNRNDEITTKIKHARFNLEETRKRVERIPLLGEEKVSLTSFILPLIDTLNLNKEEKSKLSLTAEAPRGTGIGFGLVWYAEHLNRIVDHYENMLKQRSKVITKEEEHLIQEARAAIKSYQSEEKRGRQALPRMGQEMDAELPGLLGQSGLALMPDQFKEAFEEKKKEPSLADDLEKHKFPHGSGINRWQLQGSYPLTSWAKDFPAAGAHSGGTVSFFLACNCLSKDSLFGKEEANLLGLLVSAFMNFGGYHSFVETFRIVQSIANDKHFTLEITESNQRLYESIYNIAREHNIGDPIKMERYLDHFKAVLDDIAQQNESNPLKPR